MKQASKRERRIRKDLKVFSKNNIKKQQLFVNGKPLQFEIVRKAEEEPKT